MGRRTFFLAVFVFSLTVLATSAFPGPQVRDAKLYYESGALKGEFPYLNGKLEGRVKWYYENGALGAIMDYRKNRLHGYTWTFYESGRLRKVVRLEDSKPVGHAKYFSEQGKLTEIQNHVDGKAVSRWTYSEDGRVKGCEEMTAAVPVANASHGV